MQAVTDEEKSKFVYFMQAVLGGPIKIGIASDPERRKASVQTGYPYPLRITRVVDGWTYQETRLHQAFESVRLAGEWFLPHPVLAEFANAIADDTLAGIGVGDPEEAIRPYEPRVPPEFGQPAWLVHDGHEDSLTFRPEPDDLGWRSSSAV